MPPEAPASATETWEILESELGELVWATDSRLRYEHALFECAQSLLLAPDDLALRRALEVLRSATDARYAFVERNIDHPTLGFCSRAVEEVERPGLDEDPDDGFWDLVPWEQMPTSRSRLEKGEPFLLLVEDLTGPERRLYLEDPFPVKSELDIPIFVRGRWEGLIGFADRTIARQWLPEDVRLLEIAAALIGAYWDRENVEGQLRISLAERDKRVRRERALARCSEALLRSASANPLDAALESLLDATEASSVFLERNVHDPEKGLCTSMVREMSKPGETLDTGMWSLVPWESMPLSYHHLSRGEPFAFLVADLTGPEAEVYKGTKGKSELNIPIFVGEDFVGLLGLTDRLEERAWEAGEIDFLRRAGEMFAAFWERRRAYERLERLVQSKDEFVASVSHELRTPLTVVVGLANELNDGWGSFSDHELGEFIDLIAEQGNEVANIVEDLLVVARADIGKVSVVPGEVDLEAHVREAVAAMKDPPPIDTVGIGFPAWADPTRVRQILRNLLTNTVRYGGSEVRIEFGVIGDKARLEVCDNGPGVEEQDYERIFEAYHRAHDRRGQPASVGLGLTVSKQLARLMGGDLTYFRKDGWSVFALTLPLAAGNDGD